MADEPDVSIRWSAPASCPDGEALRRRVMALVGPGVALAANVGVTESAGRVRAELEVRVRQSMGKRVLEAASCEELAESVAVVLAMSAMAEPPPPPPPAPFIPPPPAARPAPVAAAPAVEPTPSPPRPPRVRLAVLGAADVGTLPGPAVGAGLRAAVALGHGFAVGIGGDLWLDQNAVAPGLSPQQGARFTFFSADATGCYALPVHFAVEISPCAIAELAYMTATGETTGPPESPTALWLGLGVGALARWELTRAFALTFELDALVPTSGERFHINSVSGPLTTPYIVHTVGAVTARAHFGPEVRF